MAPPHPTLGCPCARAHVRTAFVYDEPPKGEVLFNFPGPYRREYGRCELCGHYFSIHDMDMAVLYEGLYVDATYGGADGMRQTFQRIVNLPKAESDNANRVARIQAYAERNLRSSAHPTLLDVGSGLAVFPYAMKAMGWRCTALDPDERAVRHSEEVAGVTAVVGDFMGMDLACLGRFDCVTFNKVLEHVEDPVAMLARAQNLVAVDGFVYIELPDGKAAAMEGPQREEFFIDHHHVFSLTSTNLLAERAGFEVRVIERLQEPSSKYTIRAFLGLTTDQ